MNERGQSRGKPWGAWALCLLLSILLHLGLAWMLDLLPRGAAKRHPVSHRPARALKIVRSAPRAEKKEAKADEALAAKKKTPPPFAKTSADEAQRRPERPDFIGRHDSVASGEDDGPQRRSEEPLPSMAGRESEEIVTFDQERQDGEPEHEGKTGLPLPPLPPLPPVVEPPAPEPQAVAQGTPDGTTGPSDPNGIGNRPPQPESNATAAVEPAPPAPDGSLKLTEQQRQNSLTLAPEPPPAPKGQRDGADEGEADKALSVRRPRRPLYDPSLSALAQLPGLRTYERRTRSTGRFVFGSRPSLNVSATARGQYEAEIYRRIARVWYAACDEHRGDIIPGSITVSLRLTRSGSIDSMDLVRRRGASLIQQSFSFGAIRHAALPPMPAEVQQEVIGRLYEMILTFNFD